MRADALLSGKLLATTEAHLQKLVGLGELFGIPEQVKDPPPPYDMAEGGVAVVHVRGMVSHGLSAGERWWLDAFDTDEVSAALSAAVADSGVRAVVLDVNSPGGMVTGTPELADAVMGANAAKPVVAHTSSLMASAAYWFAAGAEKVLATASAEVGSVGCYAIHYDLSAAHAMAGIRPIVFRSGDNKAAGVAGTKLTPGQANDIAEGVEAVGRQFRQAVMGLRGDVAEEALDGRVFTGERAVALGLVDGISDLAGAVRAARGAADERERATMEAEKEIAALRGELEAANGLLAEAANVKTELEAARAEIETAKAEAAAARDALADANAKAEAAAKEAAAELEKTRAELAEAKNLLAAAPSALKTAGTDPVAGVFGGDNAGAPKDWTAALAACGGDYVAARKKYPEAWKATLG